MVKTKASSPELVHMEFKKKRKAKFQELLLRRKKPN